MHHPSAPSPDARPSDPHGDILIVDDVPENLHVLFAMLSENGYEVRRTINGRQAIDAARIDPPDLILLDIRMPDMDGYSVCEQLKAHPGTAAIPVIFLSALDRALDKVKAFSVGGVDYITKPFQTEEVLARVKTQLVLRRQQVQLQQEILERQKAEVALQQANEKLKRLANLDGLTQVSNRRRFDEYLTAEWRRLSRDRQPLSLLLADVDHFKAYNDTYGHLAGDDCLRTIARVLNQVVKRPADLVARYGGEEFALVLPNTPERGAVRITERLQTLLGDLAIAHESSPIAPFVTLSIGISSQVPSVQTYAESLVAQADSALYRAKSEGRNTCCRYTPEIDAGKAGLRADLRSP